MLRTVQVILNTCAGPRKASTAPAEMVRLFRAGGIDARVTVAHDGSGVPRLADEAARSGCSVVVAAGGDGTIARVASALVGMDKALGVIPSGTFNFFAKKMGIPLDIESAVRTVLTGRATAINVGEVNGNVFLNNSSIGRYPRLMHQRNDAYRRFGRSRIVAFLAVGVALLRRGRMMTIQMQADDGVERVCRSEFVFVCNNHDQLELYKIRGHECLEAGALAVLVSDPLGRIQLIRLGLQTLFRRLDHAKGYEAFCARVLRIKTHRRHVKILIDGESKIMNAPLHYRVRSGALRVIVPAEASH